ncbi:ribonuclease D [Blastococcus aggregatus]|uniref:Ribonuclease D n=1 Tax=Blastococcus aggregatus TaxID=38502 RepID=A0A285VAT4_9ACTN|nr:ribonuclease D [Blastococcus aggregatus]SOC50166.1 ribonuclease D [Blastococcus aggregatus]
MDTTLSSPVMLRHGDITTEDLTLVLSMRSVAWDIETSGLSWAQDSIGTCQLHLPHHGTLMVQMEDKKVPDRLAAVLSDPDVTKVFHHAMFDLRFMAHQWQVRPASVACTKIASKLRQPYADNSENSLQRVLWERLGVRIYKDQQVSDWLAPQLTNDQLRYAAADVEHLLPLYRALRSDLRAHGLSDLYDRCVAHLPTRVDLEIGGFGDPFTY